MLYELGVAELQSGAAESARHLRQAVDALEDATSSPRSCSPTRTRWKSPGRSRRRLLDLLRRTSVRMREVDVDLHWRIEAQMIIAAHFDPELYPLVAEQLATPPDDSVRGGSGAGVLLAAWASEETRRGVSRARAVDYARRALQSTLHDPSTRFLAINFLYALTFAGEVEEAARGYEAAIALAQTHGDVLTLAILYSVQGGAARAGRRSAGRRRGSCGRSSGWRSRTPPLSSRTGGDTWPSSSSSAVSWPRRNGWSSAHPPWHSRGTFSTSFASAGSSRSAPVRRSRR